MAIKILPSLTINDIARLWKGMEKLPNGCWHWQKGCNTWGYGAIQIAGKSYRTHRIAYLVHHGIDPLAWKVLHTCDNPKCLSPDHLYLGTDKDNARDREQRNRGNHACGERHGTHTKPDTLRRGSGNGSSKLTEDQVRDIRRRFDGTRGAAPRLAKEFGVSDVVIRGIVRREQWKHI